MSGRSNVVKILRKLPALPGLDPFVILIGVMVFSAWRFPKPGAVDDFLSIKTVAHYGVSMIFLFYGLGLTLGKFLKSLGNYSLHITIHASTFLVFPLFILLLYHFFVDDANRSLWLGAFYLAALPSTVSSSVVMVSLARGNVPAAIFNASLSSILGVFITPIWMSVFLSTKGGDYNLAGSIFDLMLIVLLPVGLGMLFARTRPGVWVMQHRTLTNRFDQAVVLLIIYTSFCDSFSHHVFDDFTLQKIAVIALLMIALFFTIFGIVSAACHVLHFNREDRIAAQFCGSKKSLMHGTAMSRVLFRGDISVGVILLPLMLYHALQLIIVSILAKSMRKTAAADIDDQYGAGDILKTL